MPGTSERSRDRWGARLVSVSGLALVFVGLAYALFPHELASLTEIALLTPGAVTDVRAIYGGLQIGLGLLLLVHWRRRSLRPALLLLGVGFGCVAGARVLGLCLDGATPLHSGAAVVEALVALAALRSWTRIAAEGTRSEFRKSPDSSVRMPGVPYLTAGSSSAIRDSRRSDRANRV